MKPHIAIAYNYMTGGNCSFMLGAMAEPDARYLSALRAELMRINPPWHSDHLCFSSAGERVLHELLPLKFSEENVLRVAARARRVGAGQLGKVARTGADVEQQADRLVGELAQDDRIDRGRRRDARSGRQLIRRAASPLVNHLLHAFAITP
jgi:hypothetical protein